MNSVDLQQIINKQEKFFRSGVTTDVGYRLTALHKLKSLLLEYETELNEALRLDLGKHPFESYASEHGLAIQVIGIVNVREGSRKASLGTIKGDLAPNFSFVSGLVSTLT